MKYIKQIVFFILCILTINGCRSKEKAVPTVMYTCPMPEDSVFSEHPGQCPKCGMELIEAQTEESHQHSFAAVYTCPMHPEIEKESPGKCPVCGMDLVKRPQPSTTNDPALHTVIRNPSMTVASGLPVTHIKLYQGIDSMRLYGEVGYDPRQIGNVSSYVSGRIVKLYVTHRFQQIRQGQRIMDIYSPDLQAAQQELLFVLSADASNKNLVDAATQKLVLLGMDHSQVTAVIRNRKAYASVGIFSRYNGHIHDAVNGDMVESENMDEYATTTQELTTREGMYVEKGRTVFTIFNHQSVWANFRLPADQSALVRMGDPISVKAEREGSHQLRSTIAFIEPFARAGSKQILLRASLKDHQHLPPGTPLQGIVTRNIENARVLPATAVTSLGVRKVIYVSEKGMIMPKEIIIGRNLGDQVEVISGITSADSVVINGRFLTDNETIIRIKK